MAFSEDSKVWIDGELTAWKDATVHVTSHVIHYGTGVFEGIRCYNTVNGPQVFRLKEHIERLLMSAGIYQIDVPFSQADLEDACLQVVRENGFDDCYLRPLIMLGNNSLGVNPRECPTRVYVIAWRWGAYLGEEGLRKGIRVTFSSWTKFHTSMMPANTKGCGQYLNSYLAVKEANTKGFEEALLLDRHGNISEGSGENLFLVKNGQLFTNDADSSILMGITRDAVIQIARDMGIHVTIKPLAKGELFSADEAFFTGTAAEVTPIREVDHRVIGPGRMGPITEAIQTYFFNVVNGRDPKSKFQDWLTPVYPSGTKAEAEPMRVAVAGA